MRSDNHWASRAPQDSSIAVGAAGLSSVRMSWGGAQEAASLYDLVSLFPDATVSEVGLCMVCATALPARQRCFGMSSTRGRASSCNLCRLSDLLYVSVNHFTSCLIRLDSNVLAFSAAMRATARALFYSLSSRFSFSYDLSCCLPVSRYARI